MVSLRNVGVHEIKGLLHVVCNTHVRGQSYPFRNRFYQKEPKRGALIFSASKVVGRSDGATESPPFHCMKPACMFSI